MAKCVHDNCTKDAVMWTPAFYLHCYYCEDHIPVGFNGKIPEENRIENEPGRNLKR
jgi:hypothetical protein